MAGIYIHVPFCKKACHYCDFHFSTLLKTMPQVLDSICAELKLRQSYLEKDEINTIYFGGGTPSLVPVEWFKKVLNNINNIFNLKDSLEITLECNPENINESNLNAWLETGINRFSVGFQSFDDDVLKMMNRSHNAISAWNALKLMKQLQVKNYSADFIFGLPKTNIAIWKASFLQLLAEKPPHLSLYALTVEPKTALAHMVEKGKIKLPDDEEVANQYLWIQEKLVEFGYLHYEISNASLPGFASKHNTSYWEGKKYLGIGPSAHSYNGRTRSWNISNNTQYMNDINNKILPSRWEYLSQKDAMNEFVMTQLRMINGINLETFKSIYSNDLAKELVEKARKISLANVKITDRTIALTLKGRLYADGIAAELFF